MNIYEQIVPDGMPIKRREDFLQQEPKDIDRGVQPGTDVLQA